MQRVVAIVLGLLVPGGPLPAQTNAPARPPAPAPASSAPAAGAAAVAGNVPAVPDASAVGFWQREMATARRIVDGRTHDISALVRWYRQPGTAERPLKAWVLVVGTVGPLTAYGWEVTGFIDGQRQPLPFIVRNPPEELRADFNRRKAHYAAMQQRVARLQDELARAQELLARTEEEFRRAALIRVAGDLLDLRGQAVKDLQAELELAEEQMRQLNTGGLDLNGPFVLRCFAMKTALTLNGRMVFDHGTVLK